MLNTTRVAAYARATLFLVPFVLAACSGGSHSVLPARAPSADSPGGSAPITTGTEAGVRYVMAHGRKFLKACPEATATRATCNAFVAAGSSRSTQSVTPSFSATWGARDLESAYQAPTAIGNGQTVAIVDAYDNPNVESDLGVYRSNYGLTACTTANGCFRKVNQSGQQAGYPGSDTGWGLEIDLDVEMVSAICPNCKIVLVEANSSSYPDLAASVDTAVALGARTVSNSYGGSESSGAPYASHYTHPGVAVIASSGDAGYAAGPQFPAASQHVIAVGGTVLSGSAGAYQQTAWPSAGSGCSASFAKPSWQTDSGCGGRTIADVSAVAQDVATYDTFGQSGWVGVAGTSISAPIVAGLAGLGGQQQSFDGASNLYARNTAASFYDVTSGSNGSCGTYLCTAGTGYDGPTGLGAPTGIGAFITNQGYATRSQVDGTVTQWQAIGTSLVYVLGNDGNLWREAGNASNRTLVDGAVAAFQGLDATTVYVLGSDGNLWRETGNSSNRTLVDGTVASFKALDATTVYVKTTDGQLWRETGNSQNRVHVDGSVTAFQPIDTSIVYVLGSDGKLWREVGDYTNRSMVDAGVTSFKALDATVVYVLGSDANLWRENGSYTSRTLVDQNVTKYQSLDGSIAYVLTSDGKLWREFGSSATRQFVDANATALQETSADHVFVLGSDAKLWLEQI